MTFVIMSVYKHLEGHLGPPVRHQQSSFPKEGGQLGSPVRHFLRRVSYDPHETPEINLSRGSVLTRRETPQTIIYY